jgi:hypothetical protein
MNGTLDVLAAFYLIAPYQHGMVQMVCRVVELQCFGQSDKVQVPRNVRIPLL